MDTRGLTLRKKRKDRPVISAPQNPSGPGINRSAPQQSKPGTLAVPRERNAPTETSDLVKRRYSTRYNQLPDFSNAGAPPVPTLPGAIKRRSGGGSPRRPGPASSSRPLLVDSEIFKDPNLQHERYVTELLSNASEQDIQEYQAGLQRLKNGNSADLQRSVYQNRTQFIRISKEAEKLKTEMSVLQNLMSDLTDTLGQGNSTITSTPTTTSPVANGISQARRNPNRTSVANLEQMWNIQLQTLWKNVEKSQKFLPTAPGRHIVAETGNWIELDSATWKPKRPVHIVLLNDHLLVASKKRKRVDPNAPQQGPAPTKLVAEECWPLQDIEIIDMAASIAPGTASAAEEKAVASALSIRSGSRALTYRHEKRDEKAKNGLLMALRKASEEIRKATKTNEEQSKPAGESLNYFASRDPASAGQKEIIQSLNSARDKPDILIEVDGKQQNFRWIETQIDDLDIEIALQQFDSAVEKVEKLRTVARGLKNNSIAQELIAVKVDERAAKLATTLCRELVETPSYMEATKRTADYLIRLGYEDRARETYLQARSETLTKRARQCVFEGDLHRYVFSISYVYFNIVKNTVLIYQASFPSSTTSACIKWSNDHLETFNTLLTRQLSAVDTRGKLWRECMDVVWSHETEMLGDVGLDFREVIGRGLEAKEVPAPRQASGTRSASRSKSRVRTKETQ
ncbi:hypothetical protein PV10_04993 [Exophiala mesophila]|uniref:Exocyst complex component EXO84 n=1 Tax=Exophiala mesophila TaxID=212818 RepID=A0A0D1ZIP7_EXOME|nr:uncharacterized protein PV10_04993 [Exophiala mesophila]KIV93804.1 hypothetical protein PV10_04993 [Exophiala mesophila]